MVTNSTYQLIIACLVFVALPSPPFSPCSSPPRRLQVPARFTSSFATVVFRFAHSSLADTTAVRPFEFYQLAPARRTWPDSRRAPAQDHTLKDTVDAT